MTYVLTCKKQYFCYSLRIEDIVLKWFFHCDYFLSRQKGLLCGLARLTIAGLNAWIEGVLTSWFFIPASACICLQPLSFKFCFFKFKARVLSTDGSSLPSVKPSILRDLHVIWWGSLWSWDPVLVCVRDFVTTAGFKVLQSVSWNSGSIIFCDNYVALFQFLNILVRCE